jgi:uncharacterized protein YicC (UPF0701 family)
MSDTEFDVLDELYFVQSFGYLIDELEMDETVLKETLIGLIKRGWVKCFLSMQEEALAHEVKLEEKYKDYFYLATKAGLMAHNGR